MQELRNRITECENYICRMEEDAYRDCPAAVIGLCHVKDYLERNVLQRIAEAKSQWEDRVRANANGYFQVKMSDSHVACLSAHVCEVVRLLAHCLSCAM